MHWRAPAPIERVVGFLHRLLRAVVVTALLLAAMLAVLVVGRVRTADLPMAPLDLAAPVGLATGPKLAALGRDAPGCRALLARAGVRFTALPPRHDGPQCGYDDGIRFSAGGSRVIAFRPASLGVACPVAAALAAWEWEVVQPAAIRIYGLRVVSIDHFGSYSCRRIYGRDSGNWSEHARADAIDIAGFHLADGTRITVARDWRGGGRDAEFLHAVRDGSCRLFATVLSPDYNASHHDHLHLDQAARGEVGWRACR